MAQLMPQTLQYIDWNGPGADSMKTEKNDHKGKKVFMKYLLAHTKHTST